MYMYGKYDFLMSPFSLQGWESSTPFTFGTDVLHTSRALSTFTYINSIRTHDNSDVVGTIIFPLLRDEKMLAQRD